MWCTEPLYKITFGNCGEVLHTNFGILSIFSYFHFVWKVKAMLKIFSYLKVKAMLHQGENQRSASDRRLKPAALGAAWDGGRPRPEVQQEEEDRALLQPPPPQRHQWHGGSCRPSSVFSEYWNPPVLAVCREYWMNSKSYFFQDEVFKSLATFCASCEQFLFLVSKVPSRGAFSQSDFDGK